MNIPCLDKLQWVGSTDIVNKQQDCKKTVVDSIYEIDHQPPLLPIAVVNFDKYSGASMTNMLCCVPIPPITATVNITNTVHERQQLPLTLAWA